MTLVAAGMALLAAAAVASLVGGRRSGPVQWLAWVGLVAAAVVFVVAGGRALSGHTGSASLQWLFGRFGPDPAATGLVLDHLAGLFLLIVFGVAVPALLVLAGWAPAERDLGVLPAAVAVMLAACALIVLAGDAFVLAFAWEGLTGSFFWLTLPGRRRRGTDGSVPASLATVLFGKASGAALLLGLLLAADSGSLTLQQLGQGPAGAGRAAAYALLVAAFAVKVGLAPVQVWMPAGYGAGPGPARALMAGAAVNVGFYGLWRTVDVLGAPPGWLAIVLLLLGGLTALLGVAHATVQTRLTAVVAYSSVENAGLIVTAFGIALVGAATGQVKLQAAGLLAATLQVVAHAVGKTLLFASSGVIRSRLGTDNLDDLRGVARRLPWSGTGLAVGALTLAGLPPTVMFVSEWFLLETLMQQFRVGSHLPYALAMAAAGALVALTTGFAGVAFVRLAGFTALGSPCPTPRTGRDVDAVGKVGLLVLIAACPGLAIVAPGEIHLLAAGLSDLVPATTTNAAVASPWVLGPVYHGFSSLSPTWLAIELPIMLMLVLAVAMWWSHGRMLRVRRVEPWRSATGGVEGADQYTAFGYANPTRKLLANILLTRTELRTLERSTGGRVGDERLGPAGAHLGYTSDVVEVTETLLYRPVLRPLRWLVTTARKLQSGRLDAYLLYMLTALVIVLAVAIA